MKYKDPTGHREVVGDDDNGSYVYMPPVDPPTNSGIGPEQWYGTADPTYTGPTSSSAAPATGQATPAEDAIAHGASLPAAVVLQGATDDIVTRSTGQQAQGSDEDPSNAAVGTALTVLAWGSTNRRGQAGERIHENVGGPTSLIMGMLGTSAFTVGEDVFSVDPRMSTETESHERGHVMESRALRSWYLPVYAITAAFAEVTNDLYGGGRHFWNPMEQAAQRAENGRWFPWGQP